MEPKGHVEHHKMDQHMHLWESQKEKREKEAERLVKEIMPQNFPSLMKDMNMNIQESQQTPSKMN